MSRKIVIVDGGRMTWGYLRPVIQEIQLRENLEYDTVFVNCHLLEEFGNTIEEVEKDGFKIGWIIHNTLAGFNHVTMVKSLGVMMMELPGVFERMKPDVVLIAGDRGEALVSAVVAAHMCIPTAHIQAGERSGNIDDSTRHAIARYAHIHFAANKDATERLLKSGEQDFRVFEVGAPQLDEFLNMSRPSTEEVCQKFNLEKNKPAILLIQHSVTEEADQSYCQMRDSLFAVSSFDYPVVIILNNSDAGALGIRSAINQHKTSKMYVVAHVSREDFARLMFTCDVLVGNSSSGIIESPIFDIPVVNIGRRQIDRVHSSNVIHVEHKVDEIKKAIEKALSINFKERAKKAPSVYGDGRSAKRIVDVLESLEIDSKLLVKQMTY